MTNGVTADLKALPNRHGYGGLLELPLGNRAGSILRYDNALCFLVPLLSLYDIMPHVAYFIIPWNESRDRGSH